MQLTLDDLRKASDPLASLLGMSDGDLDRVAAEIQGWEEIIPRGGWREVWETPIGHRFYVDEYHPSRKLDQAYELIPLALSALGRYWDFTSAICQERGESGPLFQGALECCDDDPPLPDIMVFESQAGSHARAVVVLAILGLLQSRKDGGA